MVVEAKCWRAEERKARQPCSIPKNQAQTCCDVEADTATYFVRPKESTKHFPRAEMSKIGKIGSPIRWNSILFCRSSRACVWPSFFLRTFSVLASSHANSLFFRFRFLFLFFLFRLGNGRDPNQSIFLFYFPSTPKTVHRIYDTSPSSPPSFLHLTPSFATCPLQGSLLDPA